MNVNDIVAERIQRAHWKIRQRQRERQELAEARRYGLRARHNAKMRRRNKEKP
ncbi:hypothetical protein ACWGHU_12680 [Streptomyces xanthophaeus]